MGYVTCCAMYCIAVVDACTSDSLLPPPQSNCLTRCAEFHPPSASPVSCTQGPHVSLLAAAGRAHSSYAKASFAQLAMRPCENVCAPHACTAA